MLEYPIIYIQQYFLGLKRVGFIIIVQIKILHTTEIKVFP